MSVIADTIDGRVGQRSRAPVADELRVVNRELAALLRQEPAELVFGADVALADELVVCGLLGGKDVGKSTLINALAQMEVSSDAPEVGEGTSNPIAFVHESMQSVVTARLHELDRHMPTAVTTHRADALRNVVLVDLPDFDSEFPDHLRMVRAVAPLLDRVLWVLTPRKIGDRAWVEMFRHVIKDAGNVHCVLNKFDELLSDAEPFGTGAGSGRARLDTGRRAADFWKEQDQWVARATAAAGCPQSADHRFLIAAAYRQPNRFIERIGELWDDPDFTRYAKDVAPLTEVARRVSQELDRLRECVLSPVTVEQVGAIKEANQARERSFGVARIKQHFELDRVRRLLADACAPEYYQRVLNEAMGPAYCAAVAEVVEARTRSDSQLADELLERRVERWPLLRLVHWPFGWLSRIVGRRLGPTSREAGAFASSTHDLPVDRLYVGGRVRKSEREKVGTLTDRVENARSRILGDHALIASRLGVEDELPRAAVLADRAADVIEAMPPKLEGQLLDSLDHGQRPRAWLGKVGLWLIFLWFPLIQPIAEGALEIWSSQGTFDLARGLYKIVVALGAVRLLAGFAVVAAVYVALLAGMYARGLRAIRQARKARGQRSPGSEAVDEIFTEHIAVPLAAPFQARYERLTDLCERLRKQPPEEGQT